MGFRYEKEYEVHYYEVDSKLNCTIESIINFFCDIGTNQSEDLGVGIEYCTKRDMAWVFYRYDIKVNRYPKHKEKLKIVTNPNGFKKFYASRTYEVFDENNIKIVEGKALFLLLNIKLRRAIRVPDETYEQYGVTKENEEDIYLEKLNKLKNYTNNKTFHVRYSDIDSNNHVNNVKYVEWAIESVPQDIINKYKLSEISVVFEKESIYGDVIISYSEVTKEENYINISHKIETSKGKVLTVLISKWV